MHALRLESHKGELSLECSWISDNIQYLCLLISYIRTYWSNSLLCRKCYRASYRRTYYRSSYYVTTYYKSSSRWKYTYFCGGWWSTKTCTRYYYKYRLRWFVLSCCHATRQNPPTYQCGFFNRGRCTRYHIIYHASWVSLLISLFICVNLVIILTTWETWRQLV